MPHSKRVRFGIQLRERAGGQGGASHFHTASGEEPFAGLATLADARGVIKSVPKREIERHATVFQIYDRDMIGSILDEVEPTSHGLGRADVGADHVENG